MPTITWHRARRVAWIGCLLLAIAAFAVIFALTIQASQDTSSLSSTLEQKLLPVPGAPRDTLWDAAKALTRTVAAHSFTIASVRKWAHTIEFFALGLCISGMVALWTPRDPDRARSSRVQRLFPRVAISVVLCAACSLFDQAHKLFVPGREFDWTDLPFDVLGYGLAIALVYGLVTVVRLVRKRGRSRRGSHFA